MHKAISNKCNTEIDTEKSPALRVSQWIQQTFYRSNNMNYYEISYKLSSRIIFQHFETIFKFALTKNLQKMCTNMKNYFETNNTATLKCLKLEFLLRSDEFWRIEYDLVCDVSPLGVVLCLFRFPNWNVKAIIFQTWIQFKFNLITHFLGFTHLT